MEQTEKKQYLDLGYARVSSRSQNLERQETAIYEAVPDLKAKYFFEDKYTGKELDRPEYMKLKEKIIELKEANPDTSIRLTLHELDRIGRDYREIQNEVYWFRNHGVQLRFLDVPEELFNDSMGITGELLIDIVILLKSYWAEQELHYKEKRTREGIAEAKAKGVRFGREAIKMDEKQFRQQADRAIARYITHKEAMRNLGLKDYVYWKWLFIFRTNREQEESSMEKSTIQTLRNHIKENLQDIFSLVILLESDMSQQKEDEVYTLFQSVKKCLLTPH